MVLPHPRYVDLRKYKRRNEGVKRGRKLVEGTSLSTLALTAVANYRHLVQLILPHLTFLFLTVSYPRNPSHGGGDVRPETRSYPCITVEGVIGAGKTTLVRLLHQRLGGEMLLESFDGNPFLSNFYADRARYAFRTQLFFLLSRYRQQRQIPRSCAVDRCWPTISSPRIGFRPSQPAG